MKEGHTGTGDREYYMNVPNSKEVKELSIVKRQLSALELENRRKGKRQESKEQRGKREEARKKKEKTHLQFLIINRSKVNITFQRLTRNSTRQHIFPTITESILD